MEEKIAYLPLGSIVVMNGGVKKFVIIARGLQVNVNGNLHFFDYGACMYPEGLMGDQVMYFQHEDIRKVVFEGFSDEDNELMVEQIQKACLENAVVHTKTKELNRQMENSDDE